MIFEIIGMYLGYKKWGGWTGAFKGLLVIWGIYCVMIFFAVVLDLIIHLFN